MSDDTQRLRAEFSTEQLMDLEDKLRQALEHLRPARAILAELPGGADLHDLDDLIEEADAAIELVREARNG